MSITAAQLQTAINTATTGTGQPRGMKVHKELPPYGTALQYWYVIGGTQYPGRCKTVVCTASDSAAAQTTTIQAAMLAGPA